jgi:single-stranded-DNA-specific exonuclease
MACGLTIAPDRLDALRAFLHERLMRDVARARTAQTLLLDLSLAPGGLSPDLVMSLDAAGPFGIGWPGPRVAVGPVRLVKVDCVGADHVRMVASGSDGRSFKAIAFRAAATEMGQALLHAHQGRRFWLAGRAKIDDWASRPAAELHVEDAAFAD